MRCRAAVLSDIHGNADMLDLALREAAKAAPDVIVILGDLLTYGAQPLRVLERLDDCAGGPITSIFISGNHDDFYFRLASGDQDIFTKEPRFIRASVGWTHAQIADQIPLSDRYDWRKDVTLGPVYLAHANPFGFGDWSYVSNEAEQVRAAAVLREMGCSTGVFGHSHRAFCVKVGRGAVTPLEQVQWQSLRRDECAIVNPGSVGHPRGTGLSFLVLDIDGPRIRFDIRQLTPDFSAQQRAITAAEFDACTRDKLLSYYA